MCFSAASGGELTSFILANGVVFRLWDCERLTEVELLGLELSSSLFASGIAVDITSLRMLLYRQPPLDLELFPIFEGELFPKLPWRIIRRVAKVFGDPDRSRMFKLLLIDAFEAGTTGLAIDELSFDFLSNSTAEILPV